MQRDGLRYVVLAVAVGAWVGVGCTRGDPRGCVQNRDCAAGEVCSASQCAAICASDVDCGEGLCCSDGLCESSCATRLPPEVTSVDGSGKADGAEGHAAHHATQRIVVEGANFTGALFALADHNTGVFRDLEACTDITDSRAELLLPADVRAGMYTLRVVNQAGSCDSTLPILRGEPGSFVVGAGLAQSGDILRVDEAYVAGVAREAVSSGRVAIPFQSFIPYGADGTPGASWEQRHWGGWRRTSPNMAIAIEAPISLPEGAVLDAVSCHIWDASGPVDLVLKVRKTTVNQAGAGTAMSSTWCGAVITNSNSNPGIRDLVLSSDGSWSPECEAPVNFDSSSGKWAAYSVLVEYQHTTTPLVVGPPDADLAAKTENVSLGPCTATYSF